MPNNNTTIHKTVKFLNIYNGKQCHAFIYAMPCHAIPCHAIGYSIEYSNDSTA